MTKHELEERIEALWEELTTEREQNQKLGALLRRTTERYEKLTRYVLSLRAWAAAHLNET